MCRREDNKEKEETAWLKEMARKRKKKVWTRMTEIRMNIILIDLYYQGEKSLRLV